MPLVDHAHALRSGFEEDIRHHVLAHLPCAPADWKALEREDAGQLLIIYANWLNRLIPRQPRRVHLSTDLTANPLSKDPEYEVALNGIIARIESGEDLGPYLSRNVRVGFQDHREKPKALHRRRDLDLLLADWSVHHLHLSLTVEADGFVRRTTPLLLGVFKPDDAYLIDIIAHGDWSRQTLMETVVRHWPDAGILYPLPGVRGSRTYTDAERKVLRNAGVNAFLEIDGTVYASPGGLTSAGTATQATMSAISLHRDLDAFIERVVKEPFWLTGLLLRAGLVPPNAFRFRFVFLDEGYGVLEQNSGGLIRLG